VLGINMFAVKQDRIKNEHLRNKLSVCNIADWSGTYSSTALENLRECHPTGFHNV